MERRTSQRITNATILREAGEEGNRLILLGGQFFQRSTGGELIFFGNVTTRRLHSRHGRFYHKTRDGHYIFDQGAHWGSQEQAEEEGPEPEAKAIKLYYYSGQLFRRTKNGVLTQAGDILHEIRG
jgi:hypothetical protein